MKLDRQELDLILLKHLQDPSFLLDGTENIRKIEKMISSHVNMSKVQGIINQTMSIHYPYVKDYEAYHLLRALYSILDNSTLNPTKYFTDDEIKTYMEITIEKKKKKDTIVLEDVTQLSENTWLCPFYSYKSILEDFENGLYVYNPRTQRETIKRIRDGKTIAEDFNIDDDKIGEIAELMKDGKYYSNAIRWNVRKETRLESLVYNQKKKQLIIKNDENTNIDIIDGMHRTGGAIKAVQDKPELDGGLIILIHYLEEERAREIIVQESKATPINVNWSAILDNKDVNMEITKEINERAGRNALFRKFATDLKEIRYGDKLTTFDIFAKGVEYYYDLNTKDYPEAEQVKEYLIRFFNFVIDMVKDKENALNRFCFLGYIALSKKLFSSEDLASDLKEALDKIDFSQITMSSYKIHRKFIENIAKYFIEGDDESAL